MSNPSALTLANLQDKFRKSLKEKNAITNVLAKLEAKTNINREYIAYGKTAIKSLTNKPNLTPLFGANRLIIKFNLFLSLIILTISNTSIVFSIRIFF